MRLYIATKFENKAGAEEVAGLLRDAGHKVTSTWHSMTDKEDDDPWLAARRDLFDVRRAEAVLVVNVETGGCGMWIEMGIAIGEGKKVYVLGLNKRSVFHELPTVRLGGTMQDVLNAIEFDEESTIGK